MIYYVITQNNQVVYGYTVRPATDSDTMNHKSNIYFMDEGWNKALYSNLLYFHKRQ